MTKQITFLEQTYDEATLGQKTDEELLNLRNLVATNLGVATVKAFRDHDTAVAQTWKALEKFESTAAAEAADAGPKVAGEKTIKAAKPPKPPKEAKDRKPAKSSGPQLVKRPTRKMFATIEKIGEHDGTQGRAMRWPNYKNGMSIVEIMEGDGTEPWDVSNWTAKGIMKVNEPTDEEYASRRAAWYASHNLKDPDLDKADKAQAKIDAKAARDFACIDSAGGRTCWCVKPCSRTHPTSTTW